MGGHPPLHRAAHPPRQGAHRARQRAGNRHRVHDARPIRPGPRVGKGSSSSRLSLYARLPHADEYHLDAQLTDVDPHEMLTMD